MRARAGFEPWRFPGAGAVAVAVVLFLYVPILVLVLLSFSASDSLATWSGFSLRWYREVAANEDLTHAIRNSLIVGASAMAGATIAAAAAALVRGRFRGQRATEALIGLPLVVPEIVAGIAILLFFVLVGIRLGLISVILAHIALVIPVAYLPMRARLAGIDPAYAEAAADLYATPWQVFRRIVLPLIWPGIAAGAMLAFIGSLGDFVVSYFVCGPGATTLPVYVFGMVRMGVTPVVNAVSTLLIAASVIVFAISQLYSRTVAARA
jgi:spermidine/putrescine transport system permease protein